ncbi:MAG: hypothetical protein HYU66_15240 [Armatimonadetes bacterium]|nr:hypothetical protein [Armatimonadota bacterium]
MSMGMPCPARSRLGVLVLFVMSAGVADQVVELKSPDQGFRITNAYERSNLEVELLVQYSRPGTLLDTVGLNAAPRGSFSLQVGADRKVFFNVYDPQRAPGGWHLLRNPKPTEAGRQHRIVLRVAGGKAVLRVDDQVVTADCPTPLSGQPVFLGDFKGDEQFGSKYNIHQGVVGTVTLRYWGKGRQVEPSAAPVTPLTTQPASTAVAAGVVVDEAGALSTSERGQALEMLSRLKHEKAISLGILVAGGDADQLPDRAGRCRADLMQQKLLPAESALLALCGKRIAYQWSGDVGQRLGFSTLGGLWQSCAGLPAGQALLKLLGGVLSNAGVRGDPPPQPPDPTPPQPPDPTPTQPPDSGPLPAGVADRAGKLEAALRAGDAGAACLALHPDLRATCTQLFAQQPQAMQKLAALLATRRFVARGARSAEFEVTDQGRRYPITFLLVGDQWCLAGF